MDRRNRHFFFAGFELIFIQPLLQDHPDGVITAIAAMLSPTAGLFQPFLSYPGTDAQCSPATPVGLLRMLPAVKQADDVFFCIRTHFSGQFNKLIGVPIAHKPVVPGQMILNDGMPLMISIWLVQGIRSFCL